VLTFSRLAADRIDRIYERERDSDADQLKRRLLRRAPVNRSTAEMVCGTFVAGAPSPLQLGPCFIRAHRQQGSGVRDGFSSLAGWPWLHLQLCQTVGPPATAESKIHWSETRPVSACARARTRHMRIGPGDCRSYSHCTRTVRRGRRLQHIIEHVAPAAGHEGAAQRGTHIGHCRGWSSRPVIFEHTAAELCLKRVHFDQSGRSHELLPATAIGRGLGATHVEWA
jgi:hypothetical protein